jgi:hypothetical protein
MGWEEFDCISPLEYATPHHETGMNSFDSLRLSVLLRAEREVEECKIEVLFSSASAMSDISTFNPPLSSKDQVMFLDS